MRPIRATHGPTVRPCTDAVTRRPAPMSPSPAMLRVLTTGVIATVLATALPAQTTERLVVHERRDRTTVMHGDTVMWIKPARNGRTGLDTTLVLFTGPTSARRIKPGPVTEIPTSAVAQLRRLVHRYHEDEAMEQQPRARRRG